MITYDIIHGGHGAFSITHKPALCAVLITICLFSLISSTNAESHSSALQSYGTISYSQNSTTISPTPSPEPTPNPTITPTPTPTPTPTATPTPTPTPSPTLTPSPTPTPTPSPSSTNLNAIWLEHPDSEFLNLNQQTIVQKLLNGDVKTVFVQIGNWRQTGTTVSINYWWSSTTIQNTINSIKTYSNNQIEVHAWVIWSGPSIANGMGGDLVNLADSNIRTQNRRSSRKLCYNIRFRWIQ